MKKLALALTAAFVASPVAAADISTHVLDLARGVGGKGVPVVLSRRAADGRWQRVAASTTDADGRIRHFDEKAAFEPGVYRLDFDMTRYSDASARPFFPEITLTFSVTDAKAHYHVPVVVSPFGYSTYRGN
ncbi:hydroxyisourate hydrolase [Sphingomonas yantingensis]|uniref:5-hydroxyisourate hydrolase n=1 Tax=Sphingomonas yantingensis TaxID=1241761 RepID=A0A7W9ASA2_9SPHN|nr:hydroxyisourate hydrolase [Sphingomonas yantingensis]MBB5699439.1 5-hydroxyisourate hydrolase [Sphingomonas yantingensis]